MTGAHAGPQTIRIVEIYEGGLAGTSAPTIMLSSFDSTIAGTPAANRFPGSSGPAFKIQ